MTTLEVLRSARKLLSNPNRWGKNAYSRTKDDGERCYCAIGAIVASCGGSPTRTTIPVDPEFDFYAYMRASTALSEHIDSGVVTFNDSPETTYEDVMALFSKACEAEFAKTQEAVSS